jgi:hypothetical protein
MNQCLFDELNDSDFRKSKDKVLYRKKGNIPEGLYI